MCIRDRVISSVTSTDCNLWILFFHRQVEHISFLSPFYKIDIMICCNVQCQWARLSYFLDHAELLLLLLFLCLEGWQRSPSAQQRRPGVLIVIILVSHLHYSLIMKMDIRTHTEAKQSCQNRYSRQFCLKVTVHFEVVFHVTF